MMKNDLQQMIDTILARDVERPLKRRAEGDAYWADTAHRDYVPPSLTELRDKAPQHIKGLALARPLGR